MSDPKQKLPEDQVRDAALDDWRQVWTMLKARFRTGDFATGLALVDRIGEAAEAANHHPDITLTYPAVTVTLTSHDVGGLTSRDVDLARTISEYAAEAGAAADVSGLAHLELALDTAQGERLAPFYAALLGSKIADGELQDPSGQVPNVWWQEPDAAHEPASDEPEQRWHLDVWVPHDEAESRLQGVLDAGGRLVDDSEAPAFWVVQDTDGNRSCICTPLTRG